MAFRKLRPLVDAIAGRLHPGADQRTGSMMTAPKSWRPDGLQYVSQKRDTAGQAPLFPGLQPKLDEAADRRGAGGAPVIGGPCFN
jgi:hypothetical protein